jgi:hypothetical protein
MTPRSQAILDGIVDKWIGEQSPYYRHDGEPPPMDCNELMRKESRSIKHKAAQSLYKERNKLLPARGMAMLKFPSRHGGAE